MSADTDCETNAEELAEETALREKLAGLLTGIAAALRGPPPEGVIWGWHDLPELAARAMTRLSMIAEMASAARHVFEQDGDEGLRRLLSEIGTIAKASIAELVFARMQ